MKIQSPVFEQNQPIPAKYTCDGDNVSPPLVILEVPEEAASLVLICDDPDAPAGTWVHWTLWNMSPNTKEIPENSAPAGASEGTTSFGNTGYGGPCPPSGAHRYFFKLYALDKTLDLPPAAQTEQLQEAMEGHILESAELIGIYTKG